MLILTTFEIAKAKDGYGNDIDVSGEFTGEQDTALSSVEDSGLKNALLVASVDSIAW